MKIIANTLIVACGLLMFRAAVADTVTVAVASNFHTTAAELARQFELRTGHRVRLSAGSSGKLYAQILHGAPFDVFMSADELRPEKIEAQGLAVNGSRFDYARGALVLWSQRQDYAGMDCLEILKSLDFDHLAIANPATAPYGAAARDWLQELGLWEQIRSRIVTGENIGQTFHFAATRNAALGLIAASQLVGDEIPTGTCQYAVPPSGYPPIRQQVLLLKRARDNEAAREFVAFLQSAESTGIINNRGYHRP